jgi:voltage-gated potassium channel
MQGRIDKLENHYIICGFGRMGQVVCQQLAEDNLPFCVIDRGAEALREAKQKDYLCVYGESSDEDVLRRAGLDRAKALVACVSTDADNLFLILTARELNPGLQIIARAADAKSEPKLLRAGANRVVAPYMIGGQRIAQALLKPSVVDFIEIAARRRRMDLIMEEATVEVGSPLAGKSIKEAAIRQTMGLIIVAVKPSNGDMKFNPKATLRIAGGDVLIALGEKKELTKLEDACRAG